MKKLLIFNWKMAPDSLKKAKKLFNSILNAQSYILNSEIVVAPPFVYLTNLKAETKKLLPAGRQVKLGAQDVFWQNPPAGEDAYTGEISAKMLKNLGVEYVIIGHSERRNHLNETDEIINKKVLAALKAGLKVILCVGEPERELRIENRGLRKAKKYIKNQLENNLKGLHNSKFIIHNSLIVAYEPAWAIGTGHSDTSEDTLEITRFIKQTLNSKFSILNSRVLYGGSVDSKNIADFLKHPEINGALIGHASLKAREVGKIIENVLK